jgi:alpha-glucoside transport system substrate-binding protein
MAATTRRLFALHLLVVLALVVAACGEPEEDVEDDVAEDAEEETAEVAGDLSLVITWSGSELEAFQAVVDGFESEHPDVDVSLIEIPFGELNAQLTQQFATGSPPDVTVALPGLIRLFAGQGFLMPLDDLWDEWVADGQYNDALREIASADGTAYGVWFKGNVNALIWYKPAQLEELGVEVPATWDEWIAGLDTIKDAGVEPFAVGGADPWPLTQWWDPILARVGGPEAFNGLIDGSVGWDDPRVVASFEVFADLIAEYFPPSALDRGFIDETCAWADGTAAYQNQGAFVNLVAPGECDPSMVPGEDFTFFLMPRYDESAPDVQFISGDLFAVAADTPNPEAARALVRYLASAEAQAIWAERGGFVAPNADVSLDVYPDENDRMAAELWPAEADALAVYDLDDFIGGEIQTTLREALQQFVRDQDVDRIVETMVDVDERVRG